MTQSPVAIVGLNQLFRECLQVLLRRSRFTVTVKAENIVEAITDFRVNRPELAVFGASGRDDTEIWIDHIRRSRAELEGVRIVLLTDHLTPDNTRCAAAAGISAILSNSISGDVFLRSLELVVLGQQVFPCFPEDNFARPSAALIPFSRTSSSQPPHNDHLVQTLHKALKPPVVADTNEAASQRSSSLSERERQILGCLVAGAANKTIARDLLITEATVKVHIKGLLRKIRVSNRTQAAVWGLNNRPLWDVVPSITRSSSRVIAPNHQAAS